MKNTFVPNFLPGRIIESAEVDHDITCANHQNYRAVNCQDVETARAILRVVERLGFGRTRNNPHVVAALAEFPNSIVGWPDAWLA